MGGILGDLKDDRSMTMNRPYIFCHMMTSLDGKIMGKYMSTPVGFELQSAEVRNGGSVWLRYRVRPGKGA